MLFRLKNWVKNHRRRATYLSVAIILCMMFLLAFFSSYGLLNNPGDSGTVDEVAHIPSGYSYDKYFDYRLNPEHPPLAKALAALPLVFDKNIVGPQKDWSWDGINQWEAGWYMLYEAGNNPQIVFVLSRLPIMLLMIGLGLLLFKWASELFGRKVGLIVLLLYAFYPDVLAHGRLVTTDVAAAFGYVLATYLFDRLLRFPSKKNVLWASLGFAIAQLLKFSSFLLFFIFLILVIVRAIQNRQDTGFWSSLWAKFKPYFWTCVISVVFVWIVYIPFVAKTPAAIEHQLIETNLTADPRTLPLRNFLHKFEGNAVTRGLGHYLLGVMLVVGRVEGGNNTFIMGHLSDKSISWYFPVAWLLKTPITIILLSLASLSYLVFRWPKNKEKRWLLAVISTPLVVYWAFTLKGSLNIGIRHLMPTIPFVLLLIGYFINEIFKSRYRKTAVISAAILALYMIASTLYNYPNFIAYFNETTPKNQRYTRLIDSSLDWGQDLLRLKKYVDDNKITSIKVDYFGGSVPSYYIPQALEWHSSYGPTTGWLAVSATFYQSSKLVGEKEGKWSYSWLDWRKPDAQIGGSILVYHLTSEELIAHPPVSPYPIRVFEYPTNNPASTGGILIK